MKTIFKIVVAGVILMVLAIGGCAALVGGAVNSADNSVKKEHSAGAQYTMTQKEYKSVDTGSKMTYKAFVAKYGKPDPDQTQKIDVDGDTDLTVYYNIVGKGLLDTFQFSFDNGVLTSKSDL